MTAGSLLGAALIYLWSKVETLPQLYLVWALLGVAMAAVLYEPAKHGFREVGTYEKHAQLDGAWRDVVIVERLNAELLQPKKEP